MLHQIEDFIHSVMWPLVYSLKLQWFWADSSGGSSSCVSSSERRGWKRRRRTRKRKRERTRGWAINTNLYPITTSASSIVTPLRPTLITRPTPLSHQKSRLLRLNLAITTRPTLKDTLTEMFSHRWDSAAPFFLKKFQLYESKYKPFFKKNKHIN